jgi:hypothetical protein
MTEFLKHMTSSIQITHGLFIYITKKNKNSRTVLDGTNGF